jgi:DNA-binding protein HU-beta
MQKIELINKVAKRTGVSPEVTRRVVEETTLVIKGALTSEIPVFIRGFGTFMPKVRNAKPARNISTGVRIIVPAHKVPFFKPSAEFKAMVK